MKKLKIGTVWLLSATTFGGGLFSPSVSHGQNPIYGQGQGYADQTVLDRMYIRREEAKRARRRAAASKSQKRSSSRKTASSRKNIHSTVPVRKPSTQAVRKVAPASYRYVKFNRDTYQSFHTDDIKGYAVNFSFKPVSGNGKTIFKTFTYNYYDSTAEFNAIPAGHYTVKAEAVYQNKKYPVHLGSKYGTPTDPTGGNFAPFLTLEIKPGVDAYGYHVLETSPGSLYIRVIE